MNSVVERPVRPRARCTHADDEDRRQRQPPGPAHPARAAGTGTDAAASPSHAATRSTRSPRIASPIDARAVLQPLVAGERPPLLGERGNDVDAPAPLVREQVPHDVAHDADARARPRAAATPRHDTRPPLRPTGLADRRDAERVAQRAGGAAIPLRGQPSREPRAARARATAGRRTQRQTSSSARASSDRRRQPREVVRPAVVAAADPRTNSGRSGAIAPTAIAAGHERRADERQRDDRVARRERHRARRCSATGPVVRRRTRRRASSCRGAAPTLRPGSEPAHDAPRRPRP